MTLSNIRAIGLAIAAAMAFSTNALAREKVIDSNPFSPVSACSIGTSCTATPLGFTADFGTGSFGELYIYDNGLISFGSEIAAGADLTSLASIGTNVFTAGFSPSMTLSNFAVATGASDVEFIGRPVIRVSYDVSFAGVSVAPTQFDIYDLGGGDYVLQFDYGGSGFGADIANDAYLGYHFPGGPSLQVTAPQLAVQNADLDDFRYFFRGGAPAVPEPETWLMMIAGFGMAGAMLRKSRNRSVAYKA